MKERVFILIFLSFSIFTSAQDSDKLSIFFAGLSELDPESFANQQTKRVANSVGITDYETSWKRNKVHLKNNVVEEGSILSVTGEFSLISEKILIMSFQIYGDGTKINVDIIITYQSIVFTSDLGRLTKLGSTAYRGKYEALVDLNGDGNQEIIFNNQTRYSASAEGVYDVFTIDNSALKSLGSFGEYKYDQIGNGRKSILIEEEIIKIITFQVGRNKNGQLISKEEIEEYSFSEFLDVLSSGSN